MRAYVITIMNNARSVEVAERAVKTGRETGKVATEFFEATTPETAEQHYNQYQIPKRGFAEKWSREDRCAAAFMSHCRLWHKAIEDRRPVIILEHDAVFVDRMPYLVFESVVNIAKPSYGKFNIPRTISVQPLQSKRYFGGAHGYVVSPSGAEMLINFAKNKSPGPTDVFLHLDNFPNLQEYYPWAVEARDTFTTIQRQAGCMAKHNYDDKYEII